MPSQPSAKLFLYTDSTYFSGAERAFGLLAQSLRETGYAITLSVTPAIVERFKPFAPEHTDARAYRSKFGFIWMLGMLSALRRERPRAVVVNMWSPYSNTLLLVAARLCRIPAITIYHYYQEKRQVVGPLRPLKLFGYRFGERLATRVLTVSEAHRTVLIREFGFPAAKVGVLPNGVPAPEKAPSFKDHEPRRLLAVGSLEPAKGYDFVVKILDKVKAPLTLTIVGDGPSRGALEKLASASSKKVELLGRRSDMDALYGEHDILVQPSHFENLSMAIIEAMSHGLATLANDVGGNGELIQTGAQGWLLPLEDEDAWVAALEEACAKPLTAIRKNAHATWEKNFSLKRQLTIFESFLNALPPRS